MGKHDMKLSQLEKELDVTLEEAIKTANNSMGDIRFFQELVFFVDELEVEELLSALRSLREKNGKDFVKVSTASFIINCLAEDRILLGPASSWLYRLTTEAIAHSLTRANKKYMRSRNSLKQQERFIKSYEDGFAIYVSRLTGDDLWDLARMVANDPNAAALQVIVLLSDVMKTRDDKPTDYEEIVEKLTSLSASVTAEAHSHSA